MNSNFIDKSPKWRDVLIFNEDVLTFRSLSDDQISDLKTSKGDWYLSSQMPSFTNKSFREMVTLLIEDEKLRVRQMKQEGKTISQISDQTDIDLFDIENYCRGLEDE